MKAHHAGRSLDDAPVAKRCCLPHWWSEFGASVAGGEVVADLPGSGAASTLMFHDGAMILSQLELRRIVRWMPHADDGQVIAGEGAPVNGVNDLGCMFFPAYDPEGRLVVADTDTARIIRFGSAGGEVLVEDPALLASIATLYITSAGTMYAQAIRGSCIKKIENASVTTTGVVVPLCNLGTSLAPSLWVCDDGSIYVVGSDRVQRWDPGALTGVTVAGGSSGDGLHQLHTPYGISITPDNAVYVVDSGNHRVVKWQPGAVTGVVVAGGHGKGDRAYQLSDPTEIALDSTGALYILDRCVADTVGLATRWGLLLRCRYMYRTRVTRWGPAPALQLGSAP